VPESVRCWVLTGRTLYVHCKAMKGLLIIALCFVGFVFADEPVEITFGTMYIKDGKAYEFSPALEDLAGQKVTMKGYAAPPLRADWKFFVLTRIPMAVCPF
jgi:hypothetical protein